MPDIGRVFSGTPPSDWVRIVEGMRTPDGHFAWSIDPSIAAHLSVDGAKQLAESFRAFLLKIAKARN